MSEQEQLQPDQVKAIAVTFIRRLALLEQKRAMLGRGCPEEVLLEIEDIRNALGWPNQPPTITPELIISTHSATNNVLFKFAVFVLAVFVMLIVFWIVRFITSQNQYAFGCAILVVVIYFRNFL